MWQESWDFKEHELFSYSGSFSSNQNPHRSDLGFVSLQVMGPTVVGYSSSDPMAVMSESAKLKGVMRALISIPADYWLVFNNF